MSNEYYHQLYTHTMAQYNSELADANADLVRAQASGDFAGAVSAAQRMANTRANAAAFHQIAEEQAAAMRGPPQPRQMSREELLSIPDEYQTSEGLAAAGVFKSKYGDTGPDDPNFQAGKVHAARTRNQFGR
jgi:hypothetical protein